MKGITVKLSEATLRRLREEAKATGRTIGAIIRDRLEVPSERNGGASVYALTSDLAGCLAGPQRSASNDRRKFRR